MIVEKVAIALRGSMPGLENPEAWPWLTMARAAIEVMREPTPEALDVLSERIGGDQATPDCWRAAIDAMLEK